MKNIIPCIVIIILSLIISGCRNIATYHDSIETDIPKNSCKVYENNVIAADKRGNHYIPTINSDASSNKCKITFDTNFDILKTDKYFSNILDKVKESNKKPLIFIHGGLNDYIDSLERVTTTIDIILKESNYYPIFLIWPSEGLDTYRDSLVNYLQGEWDRPIDVLSIPFKFATDLFLIPAKLPINYATNYKLASNSTFYLEKYNPPFNTQLRSFHSSTIFFFNEDKNESYIANDPCFNATIPKKGFYCKNIEKVHVDEYYYDQLWNRVLFFPLKLISIPISDPLVRRAWDSMYARIRFTFRTHCPADKSGVGDCRTGVFYNFFDKLDKYIKNNSDINNITLVGHSMGTIVAGEAIREFPEIPYKNVVFSGAAISIREFKNTVEATLFRKYNEHNNYKNLIRERESFRDELLLENNSKSTIAAIKKNEEAINRLTILSKQTEPFIFYNLSLHPFAEAREENIMGAVPSGSLLEWIDNSIENPQDGLDRTLGKWTNVTPLLVKDRNNENIPQITDAQKDGNPLKKHYFNQELLKYNYMHFSRFGLDPALPRKHAHMGNGEGKFKFWIPTNWKLENNEVVK